MEQVSLRVHVRIVSAFCSLVPQPGVRRFIEKSLLLGSVIQLLILCALHYLYISSQLQDSNLLTTAFVAAVQYTNFTFPSLPLPPRLTLSPYLLSHITPLHSSNCLLKAIKQSEGSNYTTTAELLEDVHLLRIHIADPSSRAFCTAPHPLPDAVRRLYRSPRARRGDVGLPLPSSSSSSASSSSSSASSSSSSSSSSSCDGEAAVGSDVPVYLFSLQRGHLFLPAQSLEQHGARALDLVIATDDVCFGPPVAASILRKFIGYDTVLVHWGLGAFGQRGYLYNTASQQLFDLGMSAPTIVAGPGGWGRRAHGGGKAMPAWSSSAQGSGSISSSSSSSSSLLGQDLHLAPFSLQSVSFKTGALVTACFLFFATSTIVSFTLRETQARMLRFTFLLQYHIQHRLSYKILVLNQIAESLVFVPVMVGMLFFLSEFFADQLLAFIVLSLVWCGEVYSVISVRTATSLRVFPRLYCTFMTLYFLYFFHYPCGFCFLGLYTTFLFVLHSMVYFWTRFEVPALVTGEISAAVPRAGLLFSVDVEGVGDAAAGAGTGVGAGVGVGVGAGARASVEDAGMSGVDGELLGGGSLGNSRDSHDSGAGIEVALAAARNRNSAAHSAPPSLLTLSHLGSAGGGNRRRTASGSSDTDSIGSGSGSSGGALSPEGMRRHKAAVELVLLRTKSQSQSRSGSARSAVHSIREGDAEGSRLQEICDQSIAQSRAIQRQQTMGMLHGYNSVGFSLSGQASPRSPVPPADAVGVRTLPTPLPLPLPDHGDRLGGSLPVSHSTNNLIWGFDDEH